MRCRFLNTLDTSHHKPEKCSVFFFFLLFYFSSEVVSGKRFSTHWNVVGIDVVGAFVIVHRDELDTAEVVCLKNVLHFSSIMNNKQSRRNGGE